MSIIASRTIDGPEAMIAAIRKMGIVPFFKNPVPGWSIEEMTAPGCWWDTEGVLGPWDWKIEVVRDGIAYGKLLGDRAAFVTEEWYRELMNFRRSLPKYRVALGENPAKKPSSKADTINSILAKPALDAINREGALESRFLRRILNEQHLVDFEIKKPVMDAVLTFLQMGTWTLVGDFERVYRGPNLTYSGWQLSSNTTPEQFFGDSSEAAGHEQETTSTPSWAKRFMQEVSEAPKADIGAPEESRTKIIRHVQEMFPDASEAAIAKLI